MKIIKALYNFIVGDMTILLGVLLSVALLAVVNAVALFAPMKFLSGAVLVVCLLLVLVITLQREIKEKPPKNT